MHAHLLQRAAKRVEDEAEYLERNHPE